MQKPSARQKLRKPVHNPFKLLPYPVGKTPKDKDIALRQQQPFFFFK